MNSFNFTDANTHLQHTMQGLQSLADLLDKEAGLAPTVASIKQRIDSRGSNRFRIMVVGEFKRGKSTLVNAIIRHDFLPRRATPCTALMCTIQYADTPSVHLEYRDGTASREMSIEEFKRDYQIDLNETAIPADSDLVDDWERATLDTIDEKYGPILQARFTYPAELCKNGVELVDTPGLAEDPRRDALVDRHLADADAILLVCSATTPMGSREMSFLHRKLKPFHREQKLFFAVNYWNHILLQSEDAQPPQTPEAYVEETRQHIEHKLKPYVVYNGKDLSRNRIFYVDAASGLAIRSGKRKGDAEATGIPALENALATFILSERKRAEQTSDLHLIDETQKALREFIQAQTYSAHLSLNEIKEKIEGQQPNLERLKAVRNALVTFLESQKQTLIQELQASLEHYVERQIKEQLIGDLKSIELRDAGSLRQRLNTLFDYFRKDENKVQRRITDHLTRELTQYLKDKFDKWARDESETRFPVFAREIEAELKKEAAQYSNARGDLQAAIFGVTGRNEEASIFENWKKELGTRVSPNTAEIGGPLAAILVVGLADALTQTVIFTLASSLMTHLWFGGLTLIVEAGMLLWRKQTLATEVRAAMEKAVLEALAEVVPIEKAAIDKNITECFDKLSGGVITPVRTDIEQIERTLDALRTEHEYKGMEHEARKKSLLELQTEFQVQAQSLNRHIRTGIV
ncbi:MAG: dynamin family protein [Candidatus Methylacidiphilales bacterium]